VQILSPRDTLLEIPLPRLHENWKDPRNRDGIMRGTGQPGITAKLLGQCCLRAPD